jgi:hypothetical protein
MALPAPPFGIGPPRIRSTMADLRLRAASGQVPVSQAHLSDQLSRDGWARRNAAEMKALLGADESEWRSFAGGWRDMPVDGYMADGGRYRRRRYGVFAVSEHSIARLPGQPHYQSRNHNRLNGGIDRWFAPLSEAVAGSVILARTLASCREIFGSLVPAANGWRAEVHQFRIEAAGSDAGLPTPEGRHRDGVVAGLVMLIARNSVDGGITRLWTPEGHKLASFAMTEPGEALFFDDRNLLHDVTPLRASARTSASYRDVLVVTWAHLR